MLVILDPLFVGQRADKETFCKRCIEVAVGGHEVFCPPLVQSALECAGREIMDCYKLLRLVRFWYLCMYFLIRLVMPQNLPPLNQLALLHIS